LYPTVALRRPTPRRTRAELEPHRQVHRALECPLPVAAEPRPRTRARHQTIKDNDEAYVAPDAMLAELREDNLKLIAALREAKDIVDEAKDNATSGILDTWTDEAEQRAWFLFEATALSGRMNRRRAVDWLFDRLRAIMLRR